LIPVVNEQDIEISANAVVEILDLDDNLLEKIETEHYLLSSNEKKEIRVFWNNTNPAGDYKVRVSLFLGEESFNFAKFFKIEKKIVDIENIFVNDFKLGEIANFNIMIKNYLHSEIENSAVELLILEKDGSIAYRLESENKTIDQMSTELYEIKWDTRNIKEGEYNVKILFNYWETSLEKDLVFRLNENSLELIGVGYSVSSSTKEKDYTSFIVIIFVILLVAVNLFWFLFFRKLKKSPKKSI
jgi:hypothetical protein